MKVFRFGGLLFALVGAFLCSGVSAQQGTSTASVSRSDAISTSNPQTPISNSQNQIQRNSNYYEPPRINFKLPDEVAVEEFVNYHRHRLPLPKSGQSVALDARWGNSEISASQREAVLQIGFTTSEVTERTDLRPVNLSLVIDKSGSMAESDKMSRVKESLRQMIAKLRPEDIVSIVVFDTEARVLFPASRIGDGYEIRRAIDCIEPDGSTNLHGGLMLGYREAQKNFRESATNRVILLTDGIANVGIVEPTKIAAESSEYNGQGIDLSTIGVGLNLNNDLLRTLAESGRGLYHFVSDYQDIEKVFVTEVQSLVSSVAKRVEVSVNYDANLQVEKIYGYAPRLRANGFSINLDNMNNGLTQVVMVRFRARNAAARNSLPVRVRLSYFDVKRKQMVEQFEQVSLTPTRADWCELLADTEVKKNYTIAELAQSLFDMTQAARRQNYREAESFLNASVSDAYRRFPNMEDKDIRYILNIIEGYRRDLQSFNRQRPKNSDCGSCR
ncbi:MAG TPA: VWA domain-containing protein [Pyrinomonadaceae bacterium]|jgi:Mg-chelatase subunit ChlD